MSKQRASRLDRFADTLLALDAQHKTLSEMQAWLKGEGCEIAIGSLSSWLSGERQRRFQKTLLAQIASGAQAVKEVERQFEKNPAPGLETLIKLQRVILLQLSTQANTDPSALELIGNSFRAVMDSEKLKLKREELALAKDKFEFDAAQACLAKLPELKAVSDAPKLSPDEKAKAIQQILFPK